LTRFGLVVMGLWFLAFNVYQEVHWLPMAQMNDFHYFYAAAQIGVSHGWDRIYDPQLSRVVIAASCPNSPTEPLLYPPLDAWLALPLIAIPCMAAYVVFALLGLGLLVGAALLVGGRDRIERLCLVLSAVGFLPTYTAFAAGQVSPLVALALVVSWRWLREDRQVAAGLVLTTILLKPQLGLLVPVALLAAGYTRAFRIWTIATLAILLTFVLALGRGGIEQWITNELVVYWGSTYEQRWSLTHLLGSNPGLIADLAAVAAMLVIARRSHGHGPEVALATGAATTFLIAYHLTPPDFVVLLVPVWILAMKRSRVGVAAAVLGWLAAWFAVGLAVPVILFELAVLGLCAAWAGTSAWFGAQRPEPEESLPSATPRPI
jgi:hypothetical protein